MKLVLDKYSYRSGEDLLNRKPGIRREIEVADLTKRFIRCTQWAQLNTNSHRCVGLIIGLGGEL